MSDYREWSKQLEALAKHHHVIAYSRRAITGRMCPPGRMPTQQFPARTRILRPLSSRLDLPRPLLLVIPMEVQSRCSSPYGIPNLSVTSFFWSLPFRLSSQMLPEATA